MKINSAEVSDIADYYNEVMHNNYDKARCKYGIFNSRLALGEALLETCKEISNDYDTIVDEQEEYLVEMDNLLEDINSLSNEEREKIEKQQKEIEELEAKKKDGTITEEEDKELAEKKSEVVILINNNENSIKTKTTEVENVQAKSDISRSKEKVAENWGNTTINEGKEYASEDDGHGLFGTGLFASDNSDIRELGEDMMKTGNNLLEKVGKSVDIDEEIQNIRKNVYVK